MKRKLKFAAFGLSIVLMTVLSACGNSGTSSTGSSTSSPSPSPSAAASATPKPTAGSDYPTKAIMILVPFSAGGATDLSVRALAPKLEKILGQKS
jgi:hypothetical protein